MFPGSGTLVNVATVVVGPGLGLLIGARLPDLFAAPLLTALVRAFR